MPCNSSMRFNVRTLAGSPLISSRLKRFTHSWAGDGQLSPKWMQNVERHRHQTKKECESVTAYRQLLTVSCVITLHAFRDLLVEKHPWFTAINSQAKKMHGWGCGHVERTIGQPWGGMWKSATLAAVQSPGEVLQRYNQCSLLSPFLPTNACKWWQGRRSQATSPPPTSTILRLPILTLSSLCHPLSCQTSFCLFSFLNCH